MALMDIPVSIIAQIDRKEYGAKLVANITILISRCSDQVYDR